jgi:hypothetical protein
MGTASIGIFWADTESRKLYSVKMSLEEGLRWSLSHVSTVYLPLDKYKGWDRVRQMNPAWKDIWSHQTIPRGRVSWLKTTKSFHVSLSPGLMDYEIEIRTEFGIGDAPCCFNSDCLHFFTDADLEGKRNHRCRRCGGECGGYMQ